MKRTGSVILAAGDGKRMGSAKPKVLCEVLFRPMIGWVADCCNAAGIEQNCVVLGNGADFVRPFLPFNFEAVLQQERLGTGHAASMARDFIREGDFDHVAVLCGDAPFITPDLLQEALTLHREQGNGVTVITARVADPTGYGRIRREGNRLAAIVEQADADEETLRIDEINAGAYWFRKDFLLRFFDAMGNDNAQGEYYLTDCVQAAARLGETAGAWLSPTADVALGANTRKGLALLNSIARERVLDKLMDAGVSIPFPDGIVVGDQVEIGPDTVLLPGTIILGKVTIGSGCEIGPNSHITDSVIGDGCRVISSYIDQSTIEENVKIGPMSNVRPNCHIKSGAKIGDFVEIKNSVIGSKTAVAHLTYVGDSDVGDRCNFGCGTVTVNYDGAKKYRTTIGNNVFVGCNTNLIAPVTMGDRSYSAAGTTVTQDVPPGALVIGRSRQKVIEGWTETSGKTK
ncbi:bifunctional UDP-N-acetylglucosamine diphosphorylase/glucosamine-1-phosphate N-acetyltransferase GlmU [Oscillospiraceae bacterium MB08-C2-2]|nr:bifunctional UDP-N-acetylglucosamine diphosphorylase/glucosamine-1-phosphate N-acetyltransferase GlmU [Oscillospiraceae bacterium MB08-C2-2]